MNREEMRKVYEPGEALGMRVRSALSTLEETPTRRMGAKRMMALAVCMVMLATAVCAGAAGLFFSDKYDAVRLAHRALAEEYGVTEEMQTYFAQEVIEENGVTTVIFSGITDMRHVLGEYTVTITDGDASVSWSKDGQETEGGLDAHAWGAGQIKILIEMARQEGGISRGYHKAQEIRAQMDGENLTVSITKGADAAAVMLTDEQIDPARIGVSEEAAIAIAKEAFAAEYGLKQEQVALMQYEKDYAGYTYAIIEDKAICEVWFWLHQDEDAVHTEGDGLYWARINAQTGVIEELHYDSALAGNG